ncbi:unnamed protein product [Lathyrus oleraceus]
MNSEGKWARLIRDIIFRDGNHIRSHIYSSLWSGMKISFEDAKLNTRWLIGNGNKIKFSLDCSNDFLLTGSLGITNLNHQFLKIKASSYIVNHQGHLPMSIQLAFPSLLATLNQTHIPLEDMEDKCIWNQTEDGELTLKLAYEYKVDSSHVAHWGN